MRYLLHSDNATYDAASKKWYFNLDKRITHPSSIIVKKCSYVGATSTSYPSVAYLRSDTLSNWIATKHTVEVKSEAHENESNVICTLEESHAA